MDRFNTMVQTWVKVVVETNAINPFLAQEAARAGKAAIRNYGQALNLPYADEMTISLDAAASMPMSGGGPGAPAQANPGGNGRFPPSGVRSVGNQAAALGVEPGGLPQGVSDAVSGNGGGY
jgi:hypothetical protein